MPCRASPPPPPPPHSTMDLAPSPAAMSSPLVYRLRTCCLQEFLPRVSIVQKSSIPSTGSTTCSLSSFPSSSSSSSPSCLSSCTSISSGSSVSTANHTTSRSSRRHRRPGATQLCALFADKHYSTIGHAVTNISKSDNATNANITPSSSSCVHHNDLSVTAQQGPSQSILSSSLSKWQPPTSSIPLAQLQSTLAHRFLRWALSEELVEEPLEKRLPQQQELVQEQEQKQEHQDIAIDQTLAIDAAAEKQAQQMISLAGAGQDWAEAHDLVWADGDYYIAQKTCIREGVAHLKRGRRYIFVEPVLGPASSYLYPKWVDSSATENQSELDVNGVNEDGVHETTPGGFEHSNTNSDALVASVSSTTEIVHHEHEQEQDKDLDDETPEHCDEASPTSSSATETVDANSAGSSTSATVSGSPNSASSDLDDDSDQILYMPELLEPYSPLLDPAADGQDQFEYGLYELQYIPKIQDLLPQQFLPTRQSFIVHLDDDRPTLASPVPIHSKRSECRCQLMMRKELVQRDLLQVWPRIAPVRTLQERQQEAEEEARIMEIKQKVRMQTKNWRETLQMQMAACG